MFRASLCPSSGEQEQDWLKLHVKMPGCAGCGCVEPWCIYVVMWQRNMFCFYVVSGVVRRAVCMSQRTELSVSNCALSLGCLMSNRG
jgi:hypothetical protein